MSNESKLRFAVETIGTEHFSQAREAELERETETRATTAIQSHWRTYTVRRNFGRLKRASRIIQAGYRGYRGRKRAHHFSVEVAAEGRRKHFYQAAVEIQRHWRGSHSRKWIHSLKYRKEYLNSVLQVGEDLRQYLIAHHETQSQLLATEKELSMRETFLQVISGMHHLTSTEVCPGVYNSPFTAVLGGPPQVAGKTVEEHLRSERQKNVPN
mmetsp:Transcript_24034/g.58928  ORF Transcript_24034/g.58928 Transcript_24034/m.58928 type:complete len:212 (+) Transcript_24034:236-871(+)